jgi:hypothetical protein
MHDKDGDKKLSLQEWLRFAKRTLRLRTEAEDDVADEPPSVPVTLRMLRSEFGWLCGNSGLE